MKSPKWVQQTCMYSGSGEIQRTKYGVLSWFKEGLKYNSETLSNQECSINSIISWKISEN